MTRGRTFEPHDDPMARGVYPAVQQPPSNTWAKDRDLIAKWVIGLATTGLCALCGWLWTGFTAHETRLVAVETEQKIDKATRTEEQRRLDTRLDRMDRKLDEMLMWQRRDLHSPDASPTR